MTTANDRPEWHLLELPLTPYAQAQKLQVACAAARRGGALRQDLFILLEHPPVFTLGRNGGRENLTVSDAFLERAGVEVAASERGGNITYHGPGQIVGYPVMDLQAARLGVADYVRLLEAVMLKVAAYFGVTAERNARNNGIWVGARKLGSIGLCLRRGVTFHGFALNANNGLEPFSWINPCGMADVGMTSLKQERGQEIAADELHRTTCKAMEKVFRIGFRPITLDRLRRMVANQPEHCNQKA
jgi:lipoate-protein ligase B